MGCDIHLHVERKDKLELAKSAFPTGDNNDTNRTTKV